MTDAQFSEKARELAPHFKPMVLQREHTVFQFRFDADEPFHLIVTNSDYRFLAGDHDSPTLTLYVQDQETCWQLLEGSMDGMKAFTEGRYRADGNIVLSQLLLYLFHNDNPAIAYEVKD